MAVDKAVKDLILSRLGSILKREAKTEEYSALIEKDKTLFEAFTKTLTPEQEELFEAFYNANSDKQCHEMFLAYAIALRDYSESTDE